jgi:hypothetical protein
VVWIAQRRFDHALCLADHAAALDIATLIAFGKIRLYKLCLIGEIVELRESYA